MKRACLAPSLAVALFALAAAPIFAQGRPSESNPAGPSNPGSNHGAVSRGGGGGGGNSGGGGGSSSSSGGGSASSPSGGGGFVGGGGRERAVPRSGAPERRSPAAVGRGSGGPSSGSATSNGGRKGPDSVGPMREVPEYGRPRGARPATGVAIARSEAPFTRPEWFPIYRTIYPYGVYYPGYWGAGYFYYDPFFWGDPYSYGGYPYYGGSYYGGHSRSYYAYGDYGKLRLKVKPREAQVYVDGYFSGTVDQFDGIFQRLALKAGGHRIEIRADGYEPLSFEVMITPHETVTYTGTLKPR